MIDLLLYSGGVESVLCLDWAVKQGMRPFLFHFRKKGYSKTVEKLVRKNARIISPKSPYYVYDTPTERGYEASIHGIIVNGDSGIYHSIKIPREKIYGVGLPDGIFYPLEHADRVIIGYARWVYSVEKRRGRGRSLLQARFIELVKACDLPFIFPLADCTRPQIDRMFKALPEEIKENTVSSSRHYDFGGYGWIN